MTQDWNQFPAAAPGSAQPVIPRQPAPVRPIEQAIDEQRLRALELANANAATVNAQGLTPEAIHLQAQQYILNGQLPPLGMGRAAASARQAIINEAARLAGVSGRNGADLAAGFARFRNSQHTLQTLDNQLGTIRGNEATALANAQQFLDRIHELYPPGSTRLGNMIRHGINEFLNDPTQAAYNSAYTTFLTEYAKVVAGTPSGGGTLSDSARREQFDALSNATSPEAAERAVAQMRTDMQNRIQALQGNIERGYGNLSEGRPASFAPNGDMLDEHGRPIAGAAAGNREGPATPPTFTGRPPPGGPGAAGGGTPPGSAPGGEHMDRTTVNMGAPGPDAVELNTGAMQRVADPALAGLNAHVAGMIHRGATSEQILDYVHGRGANVDPATLAPVLAWRDAHPEYRGAYTVDLDEHLVPQSFTRRALTNVADTAPGAALLSAGNMVAGQQIPNLVGATGGDAELARVGMEEVRNRHPYASVAGDVAGGAMLYAGGTRLAEAGLNAAERVAPSVYARLPAWVRAGSTAADAEAAAAPYSAAAASDATLAPTATFAPRAIAGDAAIGAYESPGNRGEGALVGGLTGAGFRGTINTAARGISPTGGDLAPAYEEGVQPTLGQRMGGIGNRFEQAFQSIPLVGGIQRGARTAAQDQWQIGGFNRALRNLPDEPQLPAGTQPGTAPHAFSQDAFDRAYDRVHQRIHVVNDEQLQQDLANIRQTAQTSLSDQSLSHFTRILENSVERRLNPRGTLQEFRREGNDRFLDYVMPDGQRTGMHVSIGENGRAEISVDPFSKDSNRLGPAAIRDAAAQLRTMYPEIRTVFGARESGANPGRIQAVALPTSQVTGGGLSGSDLQQTLSEIRGTARGLRSNPTGDRELAGQLDDLAGAIHDNAARHSPAEAISTLNNINRGYGMLVRIENAANRAGAGEPGEYTAKGLLNAERQQGGLRGRQFLAGNGFMTNYARAGMKLGQTLPDSGTAERAMVGTGTLGAMGAASHFISPYAAAPWAVDTFANLPGVRNALNWALKPNRASIRPFTDEIRAQLQARAGIGSTIGLPAVVAAYGNGP